MKLPGLLLAKRFSMANFAITNQCNAACKHCSFPHAVNKCVVGLDEGIRALDSLQRLGVGVVSITGGEPFMVPYLPDLAMHATDLGMIVFTGTNGSLTTDKTAQGLKNAGIDGVWISVDSDTPAGVERNRGIAGLPGKIRDSVSILKRYRVNNFAICVINRNISDIAGLLTFLEELGFDKVKFDYPMTRPMGSSYLGYRDSDDLRYNYDEAKAIIDSILRLKRKGSNVAIINPTEGLKGLLDHYKGVRPRYGCYAGSYLFYLDWNLEMYRCTHRADRFGNVNEVSRSSFCKIDCDQCYYEGCRDYDALYSMIDSASCGALLSKNRISGIKTAIDIFRGYII